MWVSVDWFYPYMYVPIYVVSIFLFLLARVAVTDEAGGKSGEMFRETSFVMTGQLGIEKELGC